MQDTYFENPVRHWLANFLFGVIPCPGHQTAHGPNRVPRETSFLPNIFICTSLPVSYWQNLEDWFQWKMQLDFRMETVYQLGKLRGFMHQPRGRNLWMTSHNSCSNKHRAEKNNIQVGAHIGLHGKYQTKLETTKEKKIQGGQWIWVELIPLPRHTHWSAWFPAPHLTVIKWL